MYIYNIYVCMYKCAVWGWTVSLRYEDCLFLWAISAAERLCIMSAPEKENRAVFSCGGDFSFCSIEGETCTHTKILEQKSGCASCLRLKGRMKPFTIFVQMF